MSLVVVKAIGLVTIQGVGRRGRMHQGLPHGGPLVSVFARRANRAVNNNDDAPTIEICGRLVVRATEDLRVATERMVRDRTFARGDELEITSDPDRVAYLAIGGGIDTPRLLGGQGAHLSAGIGALIRAGDQIAIGPLATGRDDPATDEPREQRRPGDEDTIRVIAGPDLDAFAPDALAALCAAKYRVSPSSDRVGTRLEGPAIQRRADYVEQSRPMVIGAIEVPRDGTPIVLGPEHPTTGGYPILAVVARESLGALHAVRLGGTVRFRLQCTFRTLGV